MRTAFLFALLTAALFVPASAGAAPFVIGQGHKPAIAVDDAGTAYVAWYGVEPNNNSLRFCRLARGATACAGQAVLATTGNSLSRPFVVVAGARVSVVQYRYGATGSEFNQVFLYTSTNGGDTFDTGTVVGYAPFDEAVLGPNAALSVVTNAFSEGGVFQNVPLGGGSAGTARALLSTDRPYNGTVALLPNGRPLAIFASGASDAAFRLYSGSGSLNDAASWAAPVGIGYADYPHLAGGAAGLFLLHGTETGGLVVRRWDGTTFPGGVAVAARGEDAQSHLTLDSGGRLHAVWSSIEADGFHLVHAVSDNGVAWSSGTLALQNDDLEAQPRVAAAPDHVGVAVWESRSAGTAQIRASALGPGAPVASLSRRRSRRRSPPRPRHPWPLTRSRSSTRPWWSSGSGARSG